eukprot:3096394-Prymnesium_polylepis.1
MVVHPRLLHESVLRLGAARRSMERVGCRYTYILFSIVLASFFCASGKASPSQPNVSIRLGEGRLRPGLRGCCGCSTFCEVK